MQLNRTSMTTWYAILLCLWLTATLFVGMLWFVIGPLGPAPEPRPVSGLLKYGLPTIWLLAPIAAGPFGLRRRQ